MGRPARGGDACLRASTPFSVLGCSFTLLEVYESASTVRQGLRPAGSRASMHDGAWIRTGFSAGSSAGTGGACRESAEVECIRRGSTASSVVVDRQRYVA